MLLSFQSQAIVGTKFLSNEYRKRARKMPQENYHPTDGGPQRQDPPRVHWTRPAEQEQRQVVPPKSPRGWVVIVVFVSLAVGVYVTTHSALGVAATGCIGLVIGLFADWGAERNDPVRPQNPTPPPVRQHYKMNPPPDLAPPQMHQPARQPNWTPPSTPRQFTDRPNQSDGN
jgi:hypothetical protein